MSRNLKKRTVSAVLRLLIAAVLLVAPLVDARMAPAAQPIAVYQDPG
jgi:hypothetical protein